MYKALVFCRAGMGSSMLLKIKVDQVVSENNFPISSEHGNLDSLNEFKGDLVITMEDLANELKNNNLSIIGIKNIMDKDEIKDKLELYLKNK